ncbi:MAG: hypothetical protein AAB477_02830 [Patescibacteria group bacterium]
MKLPYTIKKGLTQEHADKWQKQFIDNNRAVFESIWRRTQDKKNTDLSGWTSDDDKRRRMLHFYDLYDVVTEKDRYAFKLVAPYLWLSLAFPETELKVYESQIYTALENGSWKLKDKNRDLTEVYIRGDLIFTIARPISYPADETASRTFPEHYKLLDLTLTSTATKIPIEKTMHPWSVFNTGIRIKDIPGSPQIVTDLTELIQYLPMQLELGCGPSVELGIPPLHYLHQVYFVSDPVTHKFILSPEQDRLLTDLLSNPEDFFLRSSIPYLRSITAMPNEFFLLLRELKNRGLLVGDVITNNFDGLPSLVGLTEKYVRQYEEVKIIPHIDFHPQTKSLFVIGTHADRRRIQRSAREHGLKVIYIDPEGYYENGTFRSYPLESPQDTDILVKMTATEFAKKFGKSL